MQTAILNSKSKSDMKLLLELAKKLGVKTKIMTESDLEDIGLANSIKTGRTKEYIDNAEFLKKLRK
jgi:hypothetical protein